MVHSQPTLTHHLFQITVRKLITTIPTNAEQDDGGLIVTPFEWGFILYQEYDS
jgi:hypothetical protein